MHEQAQEIGTLIVKPEVQLDTRLVLQHQVLLNLHIFVVVRVDDREVTPAERYRVGF